jgi:hypothetical protein
MVAKVVQVSYISETPARLTGPTPLTVNRAGTSING